MGVTAALGRRIGTVWLKCSVWCEVQSYRAVSCPIELCVDDGSRKRILPCPPARASTLDHRFGAPKVAGCGWVGLSHHIDTYMSLSHSDHKYTTSHAHRKLWGEGPWCSLPHLVRYCGTRAPFLTRAPGRSCSSRATRLLQGAFLSIQTLVAFCV
jgi:hypothetical protein